MSERSTSIQSNFVADLESWGPGAARERTVSLVEAEAYCRRLARRHYENFPVATWLLPRTLRQHFFNVYAYCRWSDDLADEVHDAERSLFLLSWWRGELEACYAGRAGHPVFVALARTIDKFAIPAEPFLDLVSAFEQDQRVFSYDTFEQLHDYCRRSAAPVGRLVLYVCGVFHEANLGWSDSICIGLQLANFWQDVARDYEIGRVYLPKKDRQRFGYEDADLEARVTNPAFIELMRFEVDRAREYLIRGLPLVDQMPGRLKFDVDLFIHGGLKILDRIEAIGYRVWDVRPVVTRLDVAVLVSRSMGRAVFRRLGLGSHRRARPVVTADEPKALS